MQRPDNDWRFYSKCGTVCRGTGSTIRYSEGMLRWLDYISHR
jgi:hypothetical protein